MRKSVSGFTIVELLIVIVVIAILAFISVVAYRGFQNRAYDSTIESDLSAVAKKLELTKVDLGRYPETGTEFPDFKLSKSAYDVTLNNAYYCLDKENQRYAIGVRSKSMKGYILNTGTVTSGMSINGIATCNAIGKTNWVNDTTQAVIQGYSATPTPTWSTGWNLTKE